MSPFHKEKVLGSVVIPVLLDSQLFLSETILNTYYSYIIQYLNLAICILHKDVNMMLHTRFIRLAPQCHAFTCWILLMPTRKHCSQLLILVNDLCPSGRAPFNNNINTRTQCYNNPLKEKWCTKQGIQTT